MESDGFKACSTTYRQLSLKDLPSWIPISWVFRAPKDFNMIIRIAQMESKDNSEEEVGNLPIPQAIIGKCLKYPTGIHVLNLTDRLKITHQEGINDALDIIDKPIMRYQGRAIICSPNGAKRDRHGYCCDATVLSSLMKGCRAVKLLAFLVAPYVGRSFETVSQGLTSLKLESLCGRSYGDVSHITKNQNLMGDEIAIISEKILGFALEDFEVKHKVSR
jgi:hypothetical protein